jgi:hypothetical protein
MLRMPEVVINEVAFLDIGDDRAAFLRSVLALLHPGYWIFPVLPPSGLMGRQNQGIRSTGSQSAVCEHCPFCRKALSDQWIRAAHSRIAGRTGGRPLVLRKCPVCMKEFGARALREHLPECRKESKQT